MCGRYSLTLPPEAVRRLFAYADQPNFPPRYNIAPTQPILTVRAERGARKAALARWGLIPGWVKDPNEFRLLINARAEGIADKPSFRAAMRHRRCLVPADGFYEWKKMPRSPKQPFYIRPRSGGLLAFAGLWETWMDREGGEIDTAAIVTTAANAVLRPIHQRMPVILPPDAWDEWLDEQVPVKTAAELLRPAADDLLEAVPISTAVNSVANDGPLLHEPVAVDSGSAARDEPAPPGNSGLLL